MDYLSMFKVELIDLDLSADNLDELFDIISESLLKKGYVNKSYKKGLKEREKVFPTGLITKYVNVALPHSDAEFIEKPFVMIVRLKNPIVMKQMGDSQDMEVKNFFFLGIKDGSKQVGLLQSLMRMFMDEDFVRKFVKTDDNKAMYELILKNK